MSEIRRSSRSTKGRNTRLEREAAHELQLESENSRKKRKVSNTGSGRASPAKAHKKISRASTKAEPKTETQDSEINCSCGMTEVDEEDERIMAECEKCLKWQHVACMFGVEDASAVPDGYLCHECQNENGRGSVDNPEEEDESETKPRQRKSRSVDDDDEFDNNNDSSEHEQASQAKKAAPRTIPALEKKNKVRGSVAKALCGIFINQAFPEASKRGDAKLDKTQIDAKSEQLALDIEQSLYERLAPKNQKDVGAKYREKYRALAFNLKDEKNPDLRRRVLSGELGPAHIVELSTEEMLNPELQKLRETVRKESIRETVLKPDDMPRVKRTHKGEEMVEGDEGKYDEEQFFGVVGRENDEERSERDRHRGRHSPSIADQIVSPTAPESTVSSLANAGPSVSIEDAAGGVPPRKPKRDPWDTADDVLASPQHSDGSGFGLSGESSGEEESDNEFAGIIGDNETEHKGISLEPPAKTEGSTMSFNPWAGQLVMHEVASAQCSSFHLNSLGTSVSPDRLWPAIIPGRAPLVIEGRLSADKAIAYLHSVRASKDIITMVILPEPASLQQYETLFAYFHARGRFGVMHRAMASVVKDAYLIPVSSMGPIPDYLGLDPSQCDSLGQMCAQRDLLLGVFVVNKGLSVAPSPVQPAAQSALQELGLSSSDLDRLRTVLAANPQVANDPQLASNPQMLVSLLQNSNNRYAKH